MSSLVRRWVAIAALYFLALTARGTRMPAQRCTRCNLNWPSNLRRCTCGEATYYSSSSTPMDQDEADSLIAHAAFEQWCEQETPLERAQRQAAYAEYHERLTAEFDALLPRLEATA